MVLKCLENATSIYLELTLKLKLDENIGRRGIELLVQAGHDVCTVVDQNLTSTEDRNLANICAAEQRCLISLDLDFANTLLFRPSDYAGLVVLRLPPKPGPEDLLTCISTLILGLNNFDLSGKLWIVQGRRIREHQPRD